jgi:hypothetical protein
VDFGVLCFFCSLLLLLLLVMFVVCFWVCSIIFKLFSLFIAFHCFSGLCQYVVYLQGSSQSKFLLFYQPNAADYRYATFYPPFYGALLIYIYIFASSHLTLLYVPYLTRACMYVYVCGSYRLFFYILSTVSLVGSADLCLSILNSRAEQEQQARQAQYQGGGFSHSYQRALLALRLTYDNSSTLLSMVIAAASAMALVMTLLMSPFDVLTAVKDGTGEGDDAVQGDAWAAAALEDTAYRYCTALYCTVVVVGVRVLIQDCGAVLCCTCAFVMRIYLYGCRLFCC